MTGSLFLNLAYKIFHALNIWYENSLIHRMLKVLGVYCMNSRIIGGIIQFITQKERSWAEGSLLFIIFYKTGSLVWQMVSRFYGLVKPALDGSKILKILSWDSLVLSCLRPEVALSLFVIFMSAVPAHYWNNMYSMAAAMVLVVLYGAQLLTGRENIKHRRIPVSLLLFLGVMGINLLQSPEFSDSLRVIVIFVSCVTIGILAQNIINTEKKLELFFGAIHIGVFITGLYGLYQYWAGIEVRADLVDLLMNPGLRRVFSTMGNPNNYAKYLTLFLPFCASYAINRKTELGKIAAFGMLAPSFIALVLTSSRAAYLVIMGSAALYVLLTNKRLVPFFILALLAAIPFIPASIIFRISTIGTDSSSLYRLMIWDGSFQALRDFWVYGIGMGPEVFIRVYRIYAQQIAINAMHSHNQFLQIWIENGIFGFVTFMVFFLGLIRRHLSALLSLVTGKLKSYHIAAICSLVGFAMFGMVEYVWFYPRVMLTFWIVSGISLSLTAKIIKENENAG